MEDGSLENFETPSTSKGKTGTKRLRQQSLAPKKTRKNESTIEQAIDKLQAISAQCQEPVDDEFDLFAKSLAYQLRNMPLERALVCQEKLQSVISQERLCQIASSRPPSHSSNTTAYSGATSSYPNSPPFQQDMPNENVPPSTSVFYATLPSSDVNPQPMKQYTTMPTQNIIYEALMDL